MTQGQGPEDELRATASRRQAPRRQDGATPRRDGATARQAAGSPRQDSATPRQDSAAARRAAERARRRPVAASEGDVVTLPRRPRRRLRRWLAAGVVVVVLALVLGLLYLTPLLDVRTVSVKGARLADPTKLSSLLQPLQGEPVARVSSDRVRSLLASEPAIQDIRLGLSSPHDVVVTVIEHREVAILERNGKDYLVGDNGARLKQLGSRKDRKLPVVKLSADDPDGRIFDTVVQALAQLPEDVLKKLDTAGAASVDTVRFKLTDGRTVVWGDAEEGAWKAADLEALLSASGPDDKTIDVSTPHKPVTR